MKSVILYYSGRPMKNKTRLMKFFKATQLVNPEKYDFFVLSYESDSDGLSGRLLIGDHTIPQVIFNTDIQYFLNYPKKGRSQRFNLKPGNCDLPVIAFWRKFPNYSRYWIIEDDVDFSGDVKILFDDLEKSDADLIATHLYQCPKDWDYVNLFSSNIQDMDPNQYWLSFLPFCGIKPSSLALIDDCYKSGWSGHSEMTWATILKFYNREILDIGGRGPFVISFYLDKYYTGIQNDGFRKTGSFGTQDIRLKCGNTKDKLWHPVKNFEEWLPQKFKRLKSYLIWTLKKLSIT